MIAFILLVTALIIGVAAWLIANGANERRRVRMSAGVGVRTGLRSNGIGSMASVD